jgi:hypothetical protein
MLLSCPGVIITKPGHFNYRYSVPPSETTCWRWIFYRLKLKWSKLGRNGKPAINISFSSVIFHDLKILQFDASNARTVKLYTRTTWRSLQNCTPIAPLLWLETGRATSSVTGNFVFRGRMKFQNNTSIVLVTLRRVRVNIVAAERW